jgi:hypothetical protein
MSVKNNLSFFFWTRILSEDGETSISLKGSNCNNKNMKRNLC